MTQRFDTEKQINQELDCIEKVKPSILQGCICKGKIIVTKVIVTIKC